MYLLEMKPIKSPIVLSAKVLITRKHVSRDYYITHNCSELSARALATPRIPKLPPPINSTPNQSNPVDSHKKGFNRKNNIKKSSIFVFESSELFADGKKCVVLATGGVNPYIEGDR
jgi:hypothetical protein